MDKYSCILGWGENIEGGGGNGTEILWYVQYILHYSYSYY